MLVYRDGNPQMSPSIYFLTQSFLPIVPVRSLPETSRLHREVELYQILINLESLIFWDIVVYQYLWLGSQVSDLTLASAAMFNSWQDEFLLSLLPSGRCCVVNMALVAKYSSIILVIRTNGQTTLFQHILIGILGLTDVNTNQSQDTTF